MYLCVGKHMVLLKDLFRINEMYFRSNFGEGEHTHSEREQDR